MDWARLGVSFASACGLVVFFVAAMWVIDWLYRHDNTWVFGVVAALMVFTALFYITTP